MTLWLPGVVPTELMWDSAACPATPPAGHAACMAYFGGSSATRAWTTDELDHVKALKLRILPVWVPTPGSDNPRAAAEGLIQRLHDESVPAGVHVMWDMETGKEPDAAWLNRAADTVAAAGWLNLVYGSTSTLFGQPPRDGYVVADWAVPRQPHLYGRAHVRATQFANDVSLPDGHKIDQSVITHDLLAELWAP